MYFAVDGMPIEMYRESWIAGLLTSDDVVLYMAGFGTTLSKNTIALVHAMTGKHGIHKLYVCYLERRH